VLIEFELSRKIGGRVTGGFKLFRRFRIARLGRRANCSHAGQVRSSSGSVVAGIFSRGEPALAGRGSNSVRSMNRDDEGKGTR
jgi:hypothetical protein